MLFIYEFKKDQIKYCIIENFNIIYSIIKNFQIKILKTLI